MATTPSGTGFVSLSQYLNSNQGAVGNTASTLANRDAQEGADAEHAADTVAGEARSGYAAQGQGYDGTQLADFASAQNRTMGAANDIRGLGSDGGTQAQLARQYGTGGDYSPSDANFDANLLSGSNDAQGKFNTVKGQFSGLGDYLNNAMLNARDQGLQPPATPPPKEAPGPMDNPNTTADGNDGSGETRTYKNYIKPSFMHPGGRRDVA